MDASLKLDHFKSILCYSPETGIFTYRFDRGKFKAGDIAGTKNEHGYIILNINKSLYRAHILAWLYMTGEWPNFDLDHEDTCKSNNRWNNIRPANKSLNGSNRDKPKNNTSGVKGVTWDKVNKKWRAKIAVERKHICLGRYNLKEEAEKAYAKAAYEYFGEFART